MNVADTGNTIYKKLQTVQLALKVPKNQYNSFGKFYYRSAEDILDAVKGAAADVNCVVIPDSELVCTEGWHYIKSTVRFVDCETAEGIEAHGFAREAETRKGSDVSQVTGAADTYALKYALGKLFCLDDTKDADAQAPAPKTPPENEPFIAACKICGTQYQFENAMQLQTSVCNCGGREFQVV